MNRLKQIDAEIDRLKLLMEDANLPADEAFKIDDKILELYIERCQMERERKQKKARAC